MQYVSPAKTGIIAACQKGDLVKISIFLTAKRKKQRPQGAANKDVAKAPLYRLQAAEPLPKRA